MALSILQVYDRAWGLRNRRGPAPGAGAGVNRAARLPGCERPSARHYKCQTATPRNREASPGVGFGAQENEAPAPVPQTGRDSGETSARPRATPDSSHQHVLPRPHPSRPKLPPSPRPPPDSTRWDAGTWHTSRGIRAKSGPPPARNRQASRGPRAAAETATGSARPGGGGSRRARDTTASDPPVRMCAGERAGAQTGDAKGGAGSAQASSSR